MRATINLRFLIGLIVGFVLLCAATVGVHAIQIGRESGFLLEQARRARDEKDFPLAAQRYQQYTKLVPGDTEALAEYGLLLADHHSSRPAADVLEKVLRIQPDRDDLRRRVVDMEMETGRYTDAEDHLKQFLLAKTPDDPDLWKLLGTCQAGAGEFASAVDSFAGAIQRDPHEVDSYANRAELLRRRLDRANEADQAMEDLITANPDSARAHALRGQYLQSIGKGKEGLEQAEKAAELAPKDADSLLLAARLTATSGEYDKARDYAKRGIDAAPARPVGYIILSRLEQRAGDKKKALAWLEAGVEKTEPKSAPVLWELGRLRVETGDLAGAQQVVEQMRKVSTEGQIEPLIELLQAQIDYGNGNWKKAAQGFELVIPGVKHNPELLKEAHYQLAACYEKLGNAELQLANYREAAHLDPMWAPGRLAVASTLTTQGKYDEALDEYRQLSKLKGMSDAGKAGIARLLILKGTNHGPSKNEEKELDRTLDQIAKDSPEAVNVLLLRVEALMSENRAADAEQLLLAARTKTPQQVQIWSALMSVAERQQKWDRMAELVAEARSKFGDTVWLRLADGSCLVGRNKKEAIPKLGALGDKAEAYTVAERFMLFNGLARLSSRAGDLEQAKKFCRTACDVDPKNLAIREFMLELAFQSHDSAGVEQVLKEIKGLEGEGPYWHYGQAALALLATPANDSSAFEHLATARELRPNWGRVPLLIGQIQDRQGDIEQALDNYIKAIDLGERSPAAVRRAIELLYSRQRYGDVDQILGKIAREPSALPEDLGRLKSEISARLDDPGRALEIARGMAADSKNWRDHLWLGQLLSMLGQRAQAAQKPDEAKLRFNEAEKSLREAVKLGTDIAETWVTLIRFYAATDRKPEAEAMIPKAQRFIPEQAAPFALGACYEAIGNLAAATKQYQTALAKGEQDPRVVRRVVAFYLREGKLDEAEAPLRKIVSGKVAAKPEDVVWARRALASVLRVTGNYQKLQEALALIEQNLAAPTASADDQWEKALALAASPQRERKQEAVRILEKLFQSQPDAPEPRLTLAQLYLSEKDWPRASEQYRHILANHAKEPRYIAVFISRLLERKESAEADVWLERLDLLAPDDFATVSLKAEAAVVRNQIDLAIEMLRSYLAKAVAKTASSPGERAAQIRQVATYYEALATLPDALDQKTAKAKLLAESEAAYRQLAKQQPDQELILASFLARRERFNEALGVAEHAWPTASLPAIVRGTGELLAAGISDPKQCDRLEKLLLTAAEKYKQPPVILLELADLRNRQEHLADAEANYRTVLKEDPNSFVAMNNLGVLLAQQKKDLPEALELVSKAIEIAGPQPTLLDSRATVFLAMGEPQKAVSDLQQAVHDEPRADRQFHLALASMRGGELKAAADALGEARKLGLKPDQLSSLEKPDYRELIAKLPQ